MADEAHFIRCTFDGSTGADKLYNNESLIVNSNAGSQQLTGGIKLMHWRTSNAQDWGGELALLGIYEGDITADGSWSDLHRLVRIPLRPNDRMRTP